MLDCKGCRLVMQTFNAMLVSFDSFELQILAIARIRERTNYNLRSSSQLLLQPYNATKTKKTLGDRAFQVASPGLWNGLPNDIRNAKTMDVFKSLVKTHLFRKAYACYF